MYVPIWNIQYIRKHVSVLADIALHTLERVATDISKINNMEKHFENVKEKYKGNNIELESLENVLCDMASNPDLRLEQDLFVSLYY